MRNQQSLNSFGQMGPGTHGTFLTNQDALDVRIERNTTVICSSPTCSFFFQIEIWPVLTGSRAQHSNTFHLRLLRNYIVISAQIRARKWCKKVSENMTYWNTKSTNI